MRHTHNDRRRRDQCDRAAGCAACSRASPMAIVNSPAFAPSANRDNSTISSFHLLSNDCQEVGHQLIASIHIYGGGASARRGGKKPYRGGSAKPRAEKAGPGLGGTLARD